MTEYITVKQLAKKLNISLNAAYIMVNTKGFPVTRMFSRNIRIPVDKLEKWLEKRTQM